MKPLHWDTFVSHVLPPRVKECESCKTLRTTCRKWQSGFIIKTNILLFLLMRKKSLLMAAKVQLPSKMQPNLLMFQFDVWVTRQGAARRSAADRRPARHQTKRQTPHREKSEFSWTVIDWEETSRNSWFAHPTRSPSSTVRGTEAKAVSYEGAFSRLS